MNSLLEVPTKLIHTQLTTISICMHQHCLHICTLMLFCSKYYFTSVWRVTVPVGIEDSSAGNPLHGCKVHTHSQTCSNNHLSLTATLFKQQPLLTIPHSYFHQLSSTMHQTYIKQPPVLKDHVVTSLLVVV